VDGTAAALRDIQAGEELTFDYGADYYVESELGCPCSVHEVAGSPYLVSVFFFKILDLIFFLASLQH
jgi:hypothetical protein